MTRNELKLAVRSCGLPLPTADLLARELYAPNAAPDAWNSLPDTIRAALAERFAWGTHPPTQTQCSDDGTHKYLFPVDGGLSIETVHIPDKNRNTLCLSTQAGCRMGCRFCWTGHMHLQAQLSAAQILNQVCSVPVRSRLTHLVFMGMGEPFDNPVALFQALDCLIDPKAFGFAPRRISVSTAGVLPGVEAFLKRYNLPLSLSLHNPFPDERASIMPVERKWPLARVIETIRAQPRAMQRRLFCEYLVIKDWNHSERHADALATLLRGLNVRLNLMRPHPVPGTAFPPADDDAMLTFRNALNNRGLIATIRRSRGLDIQAACGMLATKPTRNSQASPDPGE